MDASSSWPSSEQFDRDRTSALARWGRNITRPIPTRDIDSVWVNKEYGERRAACVFDHELITVVGPELILIGETKAARFSDAAVPFIWYWQNRLCPMWTLSVFNWEHRKTWRAFIPNGSREFTLFRAKPVKIVLLREGRCVASLEIDLASAKPEFWGDHEGNAAQPYQHLEDALGGKVYAEAHAAFPRSPEERLRKGWAVRLNVEADAVFRFFNDPEHVLELEGELGQLPATEFGAMFGGDNYFAKLYGHYHERFWLHGDEPVGHSIRLRKGLEKFPLHCDAARRILECTWFSALGTSKGQRVQSVDLDGSVRPVSIDAEALGERKV